MNKSRYIAQIAVISQNENIGPIAEAMWDNEIPPDESVNDFFEYWDNLDIRAGEWSEDCTAYKYDDTVEFNTENIMSRILEFRDVIWVDHLKMKLDTAETTLEDMKTNIMDYRDGKINREVFFDHCVKLMK